ncbi:GNAT family N-acetyltransferase [Paenibacillus alvei]|uniref:GNAT family N-acetyltransferase n=1 Tax=Paenibacillus alvei TaxID=44250 RepID=A0AAP7DHB8_PAEAL|nr:GNAT family N-acetyltransferase [Paenibacillus alvei]NOJ69486.1 GNAT family N-acetyltransferase [Paenibacillus alvei]
MSIIIHAISYEHVDELAALIVRLNREKQHHVGFCGDQAGEIASTLREDFSDLDLESSFVIACENERIVGALGFDVDLERGVAEVWGPFIDQDSKWNEIANQLWETGMNQLGGKAPTFYCFYNEENKRALQFTVAVQAEFLHTHLVLKCSRIAFSYAPVQTTLQEITPEYVEAFIGLHDASFPNTYYNGQEIISRLQDDHRIIIAVDQNESLLGYVYVEADPEAQEGNIEFIAVSPQAQGQGLGTSLMQEALRFLLIEKEIDEISLCVQEENDKAISLYQKAGFQQEHRLLLFKATWQGESQMARLR